MIPIGETYRLEARLDARSILVATILGVVTALLVAGLIWAWEASRVPTLLLITPLIQGAAIGGVLALLVGRLRLHHRRLLWILGLLCGFASVGMVHYVHYLRFLDMVDQEVRERIKADEQTSPEVKQQLLAQVTAVSPRVGQRVFQAMTGRSGFLGFMIWRSRQGLEIGDKDVKGAGAWFVWLVEAGAAGWVAASFTRARTVAPLCGDCGEWLLRRRAPVNLLSESAPALADAILADDPEAVADLLATPVNPEENRRDATRVALLICPDCGQAFASVDGFLIDHDGETTRTATVEFLNTVRISEEVATLLRDPPPPGSRAEGTPGHEAGEGESDAEAIDEDDQP